MLTALIVLAALTANPEPETDPEVVKLQKERARLLREVVKSIKVEFEAGRTTLDRLAEAARDLVDAELEVATKPAERIAARQAYLALAVEVHKMSEAKFAAGRRTTTDLAAAKAARLKAEIDLRRAGGKPPPDLAWPTKP